jgi:hypothetical protein
MSANDTFNITIITRKERGSSSTKGEGMMHTIKIFVRGGVVYEVDNLPDGFDYEIIDHDTKESATDWLDEEDND